jgi:hypothetical protein
MDARRRAMKLVHAPHMKNQDLGPSKELAINKEVTSKRQIPCKIKQRICYNCHKKGHMWKDCPMGNFLKPNLSIHSTMLRRPKFYSCARKVMSSPHSRTKAIWVPKPLFANLGGPIQKWVPKYV